MTLWHNGNFRKFWAAQTISVGGSGMTQVALPLTAVLILQASPAQMGFLRALEYAPFILMSLFAGVWVDRLPRRPILMGTNIGRALLLGSIPIVMAVGVLRIEYLYSIVFLAGVLTVFLMCLTRLSYLLWFNQSNLWKATVKPKLAIQLPRWPAIVLPAVS